jgi:hypothetical protein
LTDFSQALAVSGEASKPFRRPTTFIFFAFIISTKRIVENQNNLIKCTQPMSKSQVLKLMLMSLRAAIIFAEQRNAPRRC